LKNSRIDIKEMYFKKEGRDGRKIHFLISIRDEKISDKINKNFTKGQFLFIK